MIRPVHRQSRLGFTMVELLVVIGLVLFLMTISVAALVNSIGIARERATQTTILKIHGLMQQRIDAFNRAMERTNFSQNSPPVRNLGNQWMSSYSIVPPVKVLEVMARKQLFKFRFPQNFAEYPGTGGFAAVPQTGVTYIAGNHQQVTESSALLYWILTNSEVYGVAPVDESEFGSSEVRDTDGDGLKEFVDGWGRPLRFYRWPTHLIRSGDGTTSPGVIPSGGGVGLASVVDRKLASAIWSGLPAAPTIVGELDPLTRDPDDPTGQIYRWAINLPNSAPITATTALTAIQNFFGTPNTFHAFLIVSAGPDGILGMGEPYVGDTTDTNTPANAITLSSPGIGVAQGRLGAILDVNPVNLNNNPINDNITNRKR